MPVLDASFLVDLRHGRDEAVHAAHRLAADGGVLLLPAQAASEFLAGVRDPPAALGDLEASYELVLFGRDELVRAAHLAREATERGRFPGWADAQIGATASLAGEYVVTADPDHFRALGCRVWDYRREREPPDGA